MSRIESILLLNPFNRTILELKHRLFVLKNQHAPSFNRTILELKQEWYDEYYSDSDAFNRTILELKQMQKYI